MYALISLKMEVWVFNVTIMDLRRQPGEHLEISHCGLVQVAVDHRFSLKPFLLRCAADIFDVSSLKTTCMYAEAHE